MRRCDCSAREAISKLPYRLSLPVQDRPSSTAKWDRRYARRMRPYRGPNDGRYSMDQGSSRACAVYV